MKKSILIALTVMGGILSLTSCKKEYTCSCTESYDGLTEQYTKTTDSTIKDVKQDEAEKICDEGDKPSQTIVTETYSVECELN